MTTPLYTTTQASAMTNTNYMTLVRMVRRKGIHHYLAGRFMMFDEKGIEAIKNNKRKS